MIIIDYDVTLWNCLLTSYFLTFFFVMWSNWFEEAKKKAEEAIKATSQVVSEVLTVVEISHCLGNESSEKQG